MLRYMLNTDTCSYIMKRSTTLAEMESGTNCFSDLDPVTTRESARIRNLAIENWTVGS